MSPVRADWKGENAMERLIDNLTAMRLVVEGAVALYEKDNSVTDADTCNLIGEALYLIREHVCGCLEAIAESKETP